MHDKLIRLGKLVIKPQSPLLNEVAEDSFKDGNDRHHCGDSTLIARQHSMPTTVPSTMTSNCTTVVQLLDIVPGTVVAIVVLLLSAWQVTEI
jgi:hypothetical protein